MGHLGMMWVQKFSPGIRSSARLATAKSNKEFNFVVAFDILQKRLVKLSRWDHCNILILHWLFLATFTQSLGRVSTSVASRPASLFTLKNQLCKQSMSRIYIPVICHRRCLWRKNLSSGDFFPYDRLSCGENLSNAKGQLISLNDEWNADCRL